MSIIMKEIWRQQLKAETLKLTTEEWIFITVVPTVVKAITQATWRNADVGGVTFY